MLCLLLHPKAPPHLWKALGPAVQGQGAMPPSKLLLQSVLIVDHLSPRQTAAHVP